VALRFSPGALTHARKVLSNLCGGEDLQTHHYLCRFTLPSQNGTRERVYVLGARGRRLLQGQGIPVSNYFRPHKLKFLSYSYVLHNLILTRTLIAAEAWAKEHPTYFLTEKRISYELTGKVIPDGWLMFEEHTPQNVYVQPVLFEIDRGMENKYKFRQHVRGRINYIQSGEYKREFSTDLATIAYAITGHTEAYRITRRKIMCAWIAELLREMRLGDWYRVFKVTSIEFGRLYDNALFEDEVWYRPDQEQAVRLFE
jgi:Replication-relaxation